MREYVHENVYEGQPRGLKTTEIPTGLLTDILAWIDSGGHVDYEGENPVDVREQIVMVLEMRSIGVV